MAISKVGPKARCRKCKTVIQSTYRHDYRTCKCGAISIDGGGDYTRCCGDYDDFEWLPAEGSSKEGGTNGEED